MRLNIVFALLFANLTTYRMAHLSWKKSSLEPIAEEGKSKFPVTHINCMIHCNGPSTPQFLHVGQFQLFNQCLFAHSSVGFSIWWLALVLYTLPFLLFLDCPFDWGSKWIVIWFHIYYSGFPQTKEGYPLFDDLQTSGKTLLLETIILPCSYVQCVKKHFKKHPIACVMVGCVS